MKKLAIIVPYRDRAEHLREFLKLLPDKINSGTQNAAQKIPFQIVVVEQGNNKPFNRGTLLNIGFELMKENFDYFCFHDVDLIPITADYSYVEIPTHLAANIDNKGLFYKTYFGGVTLFNKEDFIEVNGFSNLYFGYGAEDDELFRRVLLERRMHWERKNGNYYSLPHPSKAQSSEHIQNLERFTKTLKGEFEDNTGLSNLKFTVLSEIQYPDHIYFKVNF